MSKLRQQDLPAEDLSDLGSPAARGAGLAGLVTGGDTPASDQKDTSEVSAPAQPSTTGGAGDASATRQTRDTESRVNRGPGRPRTRNKPVSAVYVSPGVKQRFETYRHKTKATNLQVVLEAISSKHDELRDIIDAATVSTAPVNPLFPADPSAVRYLGGGSAQIGFSPTPEQEKVIDRIGADLGFDTRSTWIAPILNAFLPGRKDTQPNRA